MVQHQHPAIVFKNEDVGGVGLRTVHLIAGRGGNVFDAADPCRCALDFNRYFGHIDSHE